MTSTGRYTGFRAPQGDGEILCVPSETDLPELVDRNRQRPELHSLNWFGYSGEDIARAARAELLEAAVDYTNQYADVGVARAPDRPLIVTGHQAELFHPGVWLKNFFAARLAENCGGTALNLIIDSDLCRNAAMRVPAGTDDDVHIELVPYDRALAEMPFEERLIADRGQWETFGARVINALHHQIADPLIENWWPTVVGAGQRERNLGLALSQARHRQELGWGSNSLELPQSRICRTDAFRLFTLQLFSRAAEFCNAHNHALEQYRAEHKLKNHAQPMPNLTSKDGWVESPFWLWSTESLQRRGVFVRRSGDRFTISDLGEHTLELPLNVSIAIEKLTDWESRGIKVRTRALATTLFARLLLADVFIHGIGGAKYDQVTDHICELFFGFALPQYATVSGTLRLPLATSVTESPSEATLRQQLWSVRYHPERYINSISLPANPASEIGAAIAEKRKWIETAKNGGNAQQRHRAIKRANEQLLPYLDPRRTALVQAIAQAKVDAKAAALRTSREYAYCLFSADRLREFFQI